MRLSKDAIKDVFSIKRKYLNQIYIRITFILLLIIITLSTVVYFYVQNTMRKNTYEANKQVLFQMEYNISNMDDIIKKITLSTFTNIDVMSIMNNQNITQDDYFDISQKLNVLQKNTLNFNPFIHSIYIYNNYNKMYFGTYMGMFTPDKTLSSTLSAYKEVPKIMPIGRKFDTGDYENHKLEDIFTYTMYESVNTKNQFNGAVFVNVKAQWVIDNIKTIGLASSNMSDNFYILTDRSEVLGKNNDNRNMDKFLQEIRSLYIESFIKKGQKFGFFTDKISGDKYFITFLYIKQANWIILKVQPYKEVFKNIDGIRNIIISIVIIFILIAMFISSNISKRIYKPVDNLMKEVADGFKKNINEENTKDEIQFLKRIFNQSIEVIDSAVTDKNKNTNILRTYYIRKLLTDSSSMSSEELLQLMNQGILSVDLNKSIVVCVIKMDDYKKFDENYSEKDKKLYKFAILNIAGEVVSRSFKNETIDVQNDQVVMLINIGEDSNTFYTQIRDMFKEVQQCIQNYFDISISIAISDIADSATGISKIYNLAQNYATYRYIYGRRSIITNDMVANNIENNQMGYSNIKEKKLVEAIKSANMEYTEEIITSILDDISKQSYNNILLSVMNLMNTVKSTLMEINRSRIQHLHIDFGLLNNNIFEFESLEEFSIQLFKLLKDGMESDRVVIEEKHKILIDAIKEIVNENYSDSGFCSIIVADMLKVSLTHLSRVFKNNMQVSLSDYINEIRVSKAAELLEKSDFNVNQIMTRVGIDNESNLYRNFKKKFGTTPKEYALNIQLHKSKSDFNSEG